MPVGLYEPNSSPVPRSGAVTGLAAATIAFGVLRIVVSVAAVWIAYNLVLDGPRQDGPHNPEDYSGLGPFIAYVALLFLFPFLLAAAIVSIFAGVLLVVAGMGLLRRSRSGRTLTMILGALGGSLATLYAGLGASAVLEGTATPEEVGVSLLGALVHGGYCAFVFLVLAKRKYAAEFA